MTGTRPKASEIADDMKELFGSDAKRIGHAMKVLSFTGRIASETGADAFITEAAAILHDIGIQEAERKHGSSAGHLQELEGPPIARGILEARRTPEDDCEHICRIVGSHHSAKGIDTPEFRAVWDADWIVNIPEECDITDKSSISKLIERAFKTEPGRRIARELFLN